MPCWLHIGPLLLLGVKNENHTKIDIAVDLGKWYQIKAQEQAKKLPTAGLPSVLPVTGWKAFSVHNIPLMFNEGHVYHYLVKSIPIVAVNVAYDTGGEDDTSSFDLAHMTTKPMRRDKQYLQSGNFDEMFDLMKNGYYCIKTSVMPSVRNDKPYVVLVTLSQASDPARDASCNCKSSALGRCSHVSAVLQAILRQSEKKDDAQACTDLPCKWNRGSKRKNPQEVHKAVYLSYKDKTGVSSFNPRPKEARTVQQKQINDLVCALQHANMVSNTTSMWQVVLEVKYEDCELSPERRSMLADLIRMLEENLAESITEICQVPKTESQSFSYTWKQHRWLRLTASAAKEIDWS